MEMFSANRLQENLTNISLSADSLLPITTLTVCEYCRGQIFTTGIKIDTSLLATITQCSHTSIMTLSGAYLFWALLLVLYLTLCLTVHTVFCEI